MFEQSDCNVFGQFGCNCSSKVTLVDFVCGKMEEEYFFLFDCRLNDGGNLKVDVWLSKLIWCSGQE